jgi:anti-anti-sigma factor
VSPQAGDAGRTAVRYDRRDDVSALITTTRTTPAGSVLKLAGELDHHTAPALLEALRHIPLSPGQELVLDLGALKFCDSSGLSGLIAARNQALAARATVALAAVPARIARILNIVGLDQVFPCYPSVKVSAG